MVPCRDRFAPLTSLYKEGSEVGAMVSVASTRLSSAVLEMKLTVAILCVYGECRAEDLSL